MEIYLVNQVNSRKMDGLIELFKNNDHDCIGWQDEQYANSYLRVPERQIEYGTGWAIDIKSILPLVDRESWIIEISMLT